MNKKLISLNKRLALYKKALIDYKLIAKANSFDEYTKLNLQALAISCGFCLYFTKNHQVDIYGGFNRILPELYKQRPKKMFCFDMWFSGGYHGAKDRVKCLEAAIKLTKKRINLHKSN